MTISLTAVVHAPALAAVVYVDAAAAGGNDGTSWADAYVNLQPALLAAVPGDSIWVAAGAYHPSSAGARDSSFVLVDSVAVFGGFAGTETSLSERDWVANVTILSGDIGVPDDVTDNSYHVVIGSDVGPTAVLDGFMITEGNADHTGFEDPRARGGGIYNTGGSPTLGNLIVSENSATSDGGGMYNEGSDPTLSGVTFSGNTGGAGGGLYNTGSSPSLVNVVVVGNAAVAGPGGGMCSFGGSNAKLTNVTFSGNTAGYGGGMYSRHSSPTLVNTIMWGDSADFVGDEMYNDLCTPVASYCIFEGGLPSNCLNGGYNRYDDPLFIYAPGGNLRLNGPVSSAFDAGNNAAPYLSATDRDGNPRVINGTVDIGAYELQAVTGVEPAELFRIVSVTPNPFNPKTAVHFTLPAEMPVTAEVYSVAGARVRVLADEELLGAGENRLVWDGSTDQDTPAASGVYFIRVETPVGVRVARAVLLK